MLMDYIFINVLYMKDNGYKGQKGRGRGVIERRRERTGHLNMTGGGSWDGLLWNVKLIL